MQPITIHLYRPGRLITHGGYVHRESQALFFVAGRSISCGAQDEYTDFDTSYMILRKFFYQIYSFHPDDVYNKISGC